MKILLAATTIFALAAFGLATACGDDDGEAEAGGGTPQSQETPSDSAQGDAGEEGDVAAPPALLLEQDGTTLTGSLGNHQWTTYIADAFAIISGVEPSTIEAGPMTFSAPDEPFDRATLTVFAADSVTSEGTPDGEQLRWTPSEAGLQTIEVSAEGEVDLSDLEPGEYLLSFFANWDDLGYAEYGFYVVVA